MKMNIAKAENRDLRNAMPALLIAFLGSSMAIEVAWAQSGRDALRVVSPFAAGGGREVLARTFLAEFSAALGETVIIDNRPGAGGITGTVHVARSAPDGKTLLMTGTNVLMISALAPFKGTAELLRYAKANPGKINFASAGIGSTSHLTMSCLMGIAGIDMTHIPYKSSSAAATEMLAPAGTPVAAVRRINGAMRKALGDAAVIERMSKVTIEPRIMSPEKFEGCLRKDVETASRLLRSATTHIKE